MATGPGERALTLMPERANCTPSSRVIASTPPLLAVYEICEVAAPRVATNDAVLTIEPLPCSSMCGSTALQPRYTLVRLTSCTRRQASSPVSRMESSSGGLMPALWNATSTRPNRSRASAYMRSLSSGLVTSARTARPPSSSASAPAASSLTSTTTTCAPSPASRRHVAAPIPPAPPVTTATRSLKRSTLSPFAVSRWR